MGAETARERNTGKAPPTHRLHVWWARRPLIPSRAAVLGSLLPSDSDPGKFLLDLGIRKLVNGESKFIPANPAGAKEQILKAKESGIKLSPEESYGYRRAFLHIPLTKPREEKKILDPMAGGGSIPFEALRLGHFVYTNELNPVATVILHATLKYPSMFGEELAEDIEDWGEKIYQELLEKTDRFYPEHENEDIKAFLYVREIICPSCHNWSPLFNNKYLSKAAGNIWGVEIVPETPEVSFRCVKFENAASCQDLKKGTILRGTAQCVHCNQAIPGEEIKKQARGESRLGKWRERIYAISFTRMIPTGKFYKTGVKKGQEKFKLERSFRTPDSTDVAALKETERFIQTKMEDWLDSVLIPTERIPPGNDIRPVLYGMTEWRHLFTPRQLLCHVTLVETLNKLKPDILEDLGKEKGKAVITYLQFAIDKGLDYNSRQTRWVPQRGIITGTFARHDFSIKWTYGEMIASKMFKWGLKQVTDAYREICYLLNEESLKSPGKTPLTITNFPGDHLPFLQDKAIDIRCTDPPYYDNVQYAELSDYFYVWQK
ncbi:MAG TPA: DUF1156 domain-containing protein, partial [Deltaproteobacteria bacterium]|nr:DUF1156 domain-containing protein [Deltaproteobacteria bacterium]